MYLCLIHSEQFLCLDPESLPTSKMEFFTRLVNTWKLLSIQILSQGVHLKCGRVLEFAFDNQITNAIFYVRLAFSQSFIREQ